MSESEHTGRDQTTPENSQPSLTLAAQTGYDEDSGVEATTSDLRAIQSSTTTEIDVFGGGRR